MSGISRRAVLQGAALVAAGGGSLAGCTSSARHATPAPSTSTSPAVLRTGAVALRFPSHFRWGAATSAYQIEGAAKADGKGPSVWDTFTHRAHTIVDGSTGDVADDHYHRWASDLDLMKALGLQSYRFSVSWPRVLPTGTGPVNQRGLDFYRGLVDGLRGRGIEPVLTLWHWDTPQALQDKGGWAVRDTARAFADYAEVLARALGDRVELWLTLNEPKTVVQVGYFSGAHPPGLRDVTKGYLALHTMLLGHGLAAQALRAVSSVAKVGISLNLTPVYGTEPAAADHVRRRDVVENLLYLDPVLLGHYPEQAFAELSNAMPELRAAVRPGDLATIAGGVDVLGVNYYGPTIVDAHGTDVAKYPTSQASWEQIYPTGLYDLLRRLKADYGDVPVSITENGVPTRQSPDAQGRVLDTDRIVYVRDHLVALHRAIGEGVDVRSYHLWSLLDNFEWTEGYTQRWGMVYVDFATQKRTPKASADWYSGVVRANAVR